MCVSGKVIRGGWEGAAKWAAVSDSLPAREHQLQLASAATNTASNRQEQSHR